MATCKAGAIVARLPALPLAAGDEVLVMALHGLRPAQVAEPEPEEGLLPFPPALEVTTPGQKSR